MGISTPVPWLMFMTLGAVLVIAVVLFLCFMRKPQNRHPMRGDRERNYEEIRREGPDGR